MRRALLHDAAHCHAVSFAAVLTLLVIVIATHWVITQAPLPYNTRLLLCAAIWLQLMFNSPCFGADKEACRVQIRMQ